MSGVIECPIWHSCPDYVRKTDGRYFPKCSHLRIDYDCNSKHHGQHYCQIRKDRQESKQENKMKIEQYIPKEQNEPEKKYPKWMASIINGCIVTSFVTETGDHICYLLDGCYQVLKHSGYETDFAEWGETGGEFIRFKEGWY